MARWRHAYTRCKPTTNDKSSTNGPKTLNGLILEKLETIPTIGTTTLINNYPLEIRKIQNNAVKNLVLHPQVIFDDNTKNDSLLQSEK